jgi:hypothetical protein
MKLAWQAPWLRLRSLRVERARSGVMQAEIAAIVARQLVDARHQAIERSRARLSALAHAWTAADELPRWAGAVTAHRDALADRLERDEYALIDEERSLEEALDLVQQRRTALVRATARHEAVHLLVDEQRRELRVQRERLAEREQDDEQRVNA